MNNNMFSLQQQQMLIFLCDECGGGFKIFEVADLQTLFEKCDIAKTISKMELLGFVVVKYFDETKVCLSTTQKSQLEILSFENVQTQTRKNDSLIFVFLIAFIGAFFGGLCVSLLSLFF